MSSSHRRAPAVVLPALLTAVALTAVGCTGGGDTAPKAPRPHGRAAAACRALHGKLPERVDGRRRIISDPASPYTAAWGDPAIGLRCGVHRPAKLTPGTAHYNPTAQAAEVNGVAWLLEKREDGYRFTTTHRAAYVEVTVPRHYAPEIGALTDLAHAVKASVPGTGP